MRLLISVTVAAIFAAGVARADFETGRKAAEDGNYAIVLQEWEAAAIAGDVRAQYELAKLLFAGERVARNVQTAEKWFRRAAQAGHINAQNRLGRILASRRDTLGWQEAVGWWMKAEQQGSPLAHYYLALAFGRGKGVKTDIERALTNLRISAAYGVASAENRMGALYSSSKVVPRNLEMAVTYWRAAAERNNRAAKFNLGKAYHRGAGVERDPARAVKWVSEAANEGHAGAMYQLGLIYSEGAYVAKDKAEAAKWYARAAGKGMKDAQFALGRAYHSGSGVLRDDDVAKNWYQKAAKQGHKKAVEQLAVMAEEAEARRKSEAEAAAAIQKAEKLAKERRLASEAAAQRRARIAAGKKKPSGIPTPGPSISYKGKTLIGSAYPDARNEDFFKTVKKAIDLSAELPSVLREYVNLVDTVIYNPPSKHRKVKNVLVDIVGVYTITDAFKKGPVVVYKDMFYSSPLQVTRSLMANGMEVKRHLRLIALTKMVADIKAGRGSYSADQKQKITREHEVRLAVLYKTDRNLMRLAECETQSLQLAADRFYKAGRQKISARVAHMNQLKCK